MAALVCDLCGGKLVMGSGGIATCDSCGMEHSADRMKEKVQEVKGVVQVDSSHLIDNYMRMAQNAYDSGNKAEAESYCNKILETVPTHQQAWLLKGRAAGWQSTLGNIRFAEAINCFANAIANTEEEEKESIINACKQEVRELAEALIRHRGERFIKWPDEEEKNGFMSDLTVVLQAILQFFKTVGTLINKDELMAPLATIINNSVMNAWNNVVRPTFTKDHDGHPSDYALNKLIDRARHCTDLLEQAVNLSESDIESDIQYYKNLIAIHEYLINAQSYSYETVKVGNSSWDGSAIYENQYVKSKTLTDEAKSQRRQLISTYEKKIKTRKKDGFWLNYKSEYEFLKKELRKSTKERDKLVAAKTGYTKIERITAHMAEIEVILEKDRVPTSKIEKTEIDFIKNCEAFWEKLASDDGGYDAYLDKYPILKQATGLANQRETLLTQKRRIADAKANNSMTPFIVTLLLTVASVILAFTVLYFIGWVLAGILGFVCYALWSSLDEKKKTIFAEEEKYAREVHTYNANVDKMLAVPKYEGHVDRDKEIKIPAKLD